jgi:hypothetical protein
MCHWHSLVFGIMGAQFLLLAALCALIPVAHGGADGQCGSDARSKLRERTEAYVTAFDALDWAGCAALMEPGFVLQDPAGVPA